MIHHGNIVSTFPTHNNGFRRKISCVDICQDLVAIGSNDGNIELNQLILCQTRLHVSLLAHIVLPSTVSDVFYNSTLKDKVKDHHRSVTVIKISSNMEKLAFGTASGEIFVFDIKDIESSKILGTHNDHKGYVVKSLCWSPHSELLISGCSSGRIVEWKPNDANAEEKLSFGWAKSLLGFRSGNLLHLCGSAVSKVEIASKLGVNVDDWDYNESSVYNYLLLVSAGNLTILLDIQRECNAGKWESKVTKTVKVEPGISLTPTLAASTFSISFTKGGKVPRASGFLSCRKGNSIGPELIFCDIEGENYKTFNLKFVSNRITIPSVDSQNLSFGHIANTNLEENKNIIPFGFRYAIVSDESRHKHLLFVISDDYKLCVIDIINMTIQFFPMFFDSDIQSIAISSNKLLVLRYDRLCELNLIDLFELSAPSIVGIPMIILNSSIYRAIRSIQRMWRVKNRCNGDIWRNVLSPQALKLITESLNSNKSTSSSTHYDDDGSEQYVDKSIANYLVWSQSALDQSNHGPILEEDVNIEKSKEMFTLIDNLEAQIDKALMSADADVESAIFNEDSQLLIFSNFCSGGSGAGWNLDDIAEYGLPITADEQGRVRSLPVMVVEQLRSLHACVSEDPNDDPIHMMALNRKNTLVNALSVLTAPDVTSFTRIDLSKHSTHEGSPVSTYSQPSSSSRTFTTKFTKKLNDQLTELSLGSNANEIISGGITTPDGNITPNNLKSVGLTSDGDEQADFYREIDMLLYWTDKILQPTYGVFTPSPVKGSFDPISNPGFKLDVPLEYFLLEADHLMEMSSKAINSDPGWHYTGFKNSHSTTPAEMALIVPDYSIELMQYDETVKSSLQQIHRISIDLSEFKNTPESIQEVSSHENFEPVQHSHISKDSYDRCSPILEQDESEINDDLGNDNRKSFDLRASEQDSMTPNVKYSSTARRYTNDECDYHTLSNIPEAISDDERSIYSCDDSDEDDMDFVRKSSEVCWLENWWSNDKKTHHLKESYISVKSRLKTVAANRTNPEFHLLNNELSRRIKDSDNDYDLEHGTGAIFFDAFKPADTNDTKYCVVRSMGLNRSKDVHPISHSTALVSIRDKVDKTGEDIAILDEYYQRSYEVILYAPFGLGISFLLTLQDQLIVTSFKKLQNGDSGPAELSEKICIGDQLLSVNDEAVEGVGLERLAELLDANILNQTDKNHMIKLRFRQLEFDEYSPTRGCERSVVTLCARNDEMKQTHQQNIILTGNPLLDLFAPDISVSDGNNGDSPTIRCIEPVFASKDASNRTNIKYNNLFDISIVDDHVYINVMEFATMKPEEVVVDERSMENQHSSISKHSYPFMLTSSIILKDSKWTDYLLSPSPNDCQIINRKDVIDYLMIIQKQQRISEYSRYFCDSKYPILLRTFESDVATSTISPDSYCNQLVFVEGSHEVCQDMEGEYMNTVKMMKKRSVCDMTSFLYQSRDSDSTDQSSLASESVKDEANGYSQHPTASTDIDKTFNISSETINSYSYMAWERYYYEIIKGNIAKELQQFRNRSLRINRRKSSDYTGLLKSNSGDGVHDGIQHASQTKPLNPFDIKNFPEIDIPSYSELGIYLPSYSVTIQLLTYIHESTRILSADDVNRNACVDIIYKHLFDLIQEWITIFVPLPVEYRQKLWLTPVDITRDYATSHGFSTSQDMSDYLRLVNDLVTLFFGLRSFGKELLGSMTDNYHRIDSMSYRDERIGALVSSTTNQSWAKLFHGGYLRQFNAVNSLVWTDDDMTTYAMKFASYVHVDFIVHCCGFYHASKTLQIALDIANHDPRTDIATFTLLNLIKDKENKVLSTRGLFKGLYESVGQDCPSIYCGIIHVLGSISRKDNKLAADLATVCFPQLNPWIFKYILFGASWESEFIPRYRANFSLDNHEDDGTKDSNVLSMRSNDENDLVDNVVLMEWYSKARRLYQLYLQSIIRRFRCGDCKKLVQEWVELMLYLNHGFDSGISSKSIDSVIAGDGKIMSVSDQYQANIEAVIEHPEIYSYDPLEMAEVCLKYNYHDLALNCVRSSICNVLNFSDAITSQSDVSESRSMKDCLRDINAVLIRVRDSVLGKFVENIIEIHVMNSKVIDREMNRPSSKGLSDEISMEQLGKEMKRSINDKRLILLKLFRLQYAWTKLSLCLSRDFETLNSEEMNKMIRYLNEVWHAIYQSIKLKMNNVSDGLEKRVTSTLSNIMASTLIMVVDKEFGMNIIEQNHQIVDSLSIEFFQWLYRSANRFNH